MGHWRGMSGAIVINPGRAGARRASPSATGAAPDHGTATATPSLIAIRGDASRRACHATWHTSRPSAVRSGWASSQGTIGSFTTMSGVTAFPIGTILTSLSMRSFATSRQWLTREEIAQKSREREVATQHKSQFVANMSHELRTPLASHFTNDDHARRRGARARTSGSTCSHDDRRGGSGSRDADIRGPVQ